MYSLEQIADMLESAPRVFKKPQNVGKTEAAHNLTPTGCVMISDSLAKAFAASLRNHARGEPPNAVSVNRR